MHQAPSIASPQTPSDKAPLTKAAIGWHALAILVALGLGAAGANKLRGPADMIAAFTSWGLPAWFVYVTGAVEVVGAVLLVIPRTRAFGAALLAATMGGAVATHALHAHPFADWIPALVFLALTALLTWRERAKLLALIGR